MHERATCAISDTKNVRPYGYYAQKKTLRPTQKTLGGWDYFRKDYMVQDQVECNQPISSSHFVEDVDPSPLTTWQLPTLLKKGFDTYHPETYMKKNVMVFAEQDKDLVTKEIYDYMEKDPMKLYTKYSEVIDDGKFELSQSCRHMVEKVRF
jgi:hypothetical protein